MAQTAQVDKIGRFVALIPAAEAVGGIFGPMINGLILERSGVNEMIILTIVIFIIGAIVFAYVDRKDIKKNARRIADKRLIFFILCEFRVMKLCLI